MTRTKLDDLQESTDHELVELTDEQLVQVFGGANDGTRATNVVLGGGDDDGPGGTGGHSIV